MILFYKTKNEGSEVRKTIWNVQKELLYKKFVNKKVFVCVIEIKIRHLIFLEVQSQIISLREVKIAVVKEFRQN